MLAETIYTLLILFLKKFPKNICIGSFLNYHIMYSNRLNKLERLLMQQVDLKSVLNSRNIFKNIFFKKFLYLCTDWLNDVRHVS